MLEARIAPATILVDTVADSGPGSLRQAILESNATPGDRDMIVFNIPGPGVQTIELSSAPLPAISDPVDILGYTQPGSQPNTLPQGSYATNAMLNIVLDGTQLTAGDGLTLASPNSVVEGLVIHGFKGAGIFISGAGATLNVIRGNFIGTDAAGTTSKENMAGGIVIVQGGGNLIGDATPAGINIISGNRIAGILIDSAQNTPGNGNVVLGNLIGVAADGVSPVGNAGNGVALRDSRSQLIGSTTPGAANVISYNTQDGVAVGIMSGQQEAITFGNAIRGNVIEKNGGLGINLGRDGVTPNDSGDLDPGANGRQNFPIILGADVQSTTLSIQGAIQSTPNSTFFIDIFGSSAPDPSGFGEGGKPLGSTAVTTDAAGNGSFTVNVAGDFRGLIFSATATDQGAANTSEFSPVFSPLLVTTALDIVSATDGVTSLREAISYANANTNSGAPDVIRFNIPGGGVHTITLSGALGILPAITDQVVIDGYSQPGSSMNTLALGNDAVLLIELDGQNIATGPNRDGLRIAAGGSTITGLIINRFPGYAISLLNADGNRVGGNWLGPNADGVTAPVNGQFGLLISDSGANLIGGAAPGMRNVISGNDGNGIEIIGTLATDNVIQGNYIGTTKDGSAALSNGFDGIYTQGSGTIIGGAAPGEGNVISASTFSVGVLIDLGSSGSSVVQGNFIGTDANGLLDLGNADFGIEVINSPNVLIGGAAPGAGNIVSGNGGIGISIEGPGSTNAVIQGNLVGTNITKAGAIPNGLAGIQIYGSNGVLVGGTNPGEANVIAFNGADGVVIDAAGLAASQNSVRGNSISANAGLGINQLGGTENGAGVTANDPADGDGGPNALQNFPILVTATRAGSVQSVSGSLNSVPGTSFFIDLYASSASDLSGHGEGARFLGETIATTDGTGNAVFTFNPMLLLAPGVFITAVATNQATGDSSEFSAAIPLTGTFVWDNDSGDGDWFNPINWNLDSGVPGAADAAVLNINSTITLTADVSVGSFSQSVGSFTSAPGVTFSILDQFDWTGGTQSGAGTTLLGSSATSSISGASDKHLDGRTLINDGTLLWTGTGQFALDSGRVINRGVFDIQTDAAVAVTGGLPLIVNAATGTLKKTAGTGTTTISMGISVTNSGTISAESGTLDLGSAFTQDAGSTLLAGGALTSPGTLTFNGGTLEGNGMIGGSVDNAGGAVRPGGELLEGQISIAGNYTQGPGGTLEIELGGTGGGEFDRLDVNGSVDLDGDFVVTELAPFVIPVPSSYSVLSYSGRLGTFAAVSEPGSLTVDYQTNAVVLTAETAPLVVTTALDVVDPGDGVLSLREAMIAANSTPGIDTITFAIPGAGVHTIVPLDSGSGTSLPEILEAVIIDGWSQGGPGYNGSPLIEIDGTLSATSGLGSFAFFVSADDVVIRGFAINRFPNVAGNGYGIGIFAANAWIYGNFIGTNAAGTVAMGNGQGGIWLGPGSSDALIGTNADGTDDAAERNIISGNLGDGIFADSSGHIIRGNFIGTDVTGLVAIPNQGHGIMITNGSMSHVVGGTTVAERNVISGNVGAGIQISGGSQDITILGNFVGLNASGTGVLGNAQGIVVAGGAANNLIGGSAVGAGNVISGNAGSGISLANTSGNAVEHNFIGTDPSGTVARANGIGIEFVNNASSNTVQSNLISGNTNEGVYIRANGGGQNSFGLNLIGTTISGTSALPNAIGIRIGNDSLFNTIGGTSTEDENIIAFNMGNGIQVEGAGTVGHRVLRNVIFGNGGLGIDLGADGVTANDATDSDIGPNGFLNFPVFTSAIFDGSTTMVSGSLVTDVSGSVRIEFFLADASGQGIEFRTSMTLESTPGVEVPFSIALSGVEAGDRIVATATQLTATGRGTSEFSNPITSTLPVAVSISDAAIVEGPSGASTQLVFTVTLDMMVPVSVTVDFSTGDYSGDSRNAMAGIDYVATSGQIVFAPGETTQTITVSITGDDFGEPRERFVVSLSNADEATIDDGDGVGVILDDDHHLFAAAEGSGNSFSVFVADESGATRVQTLDVFAPNYRGGVRLAVGDVTGDGVDDFIAGGGLGSRAKVIVFDGVSFLPLDNALGNLSAFGSSYRGGVFVASGDVDADGHADVIVAPSAGSLNQVKVFSGADGSLLNSFRAFGAGAGGVRVAAGDFNGDGLADIVTGTGVGSSVRVFNAMSGTLLTDEGGEFRAFGRTYRGGIHVSGGDINADGTDDILVGAASGAPRVLAYLQGEAAGSGPERFLAYGGKALRGVRLSALDVNGDGVADIISSKGRQGDSTLTVLHGATRDRLYSVSTFGLQQDGIYIA